MLRSVNSFAMSVVESLSVLSLCMFKTVRLLNRSWFILERSHVFCLRAVEKDLSPAALVAGFTRISLHNVITSFGISRSGLGSSLIFTMMSKQKNYHLYGVPLRKKYPSGKISSQKWKKVIENKISVQI